MSNPHARALRSVRADMLGTDDETHYWECHAAAEEIKRLESKLVEAQEAVNDANGQRMETFLELAQAKQDLSSALGRLDSCVEALECLLPGLTLDLRYATEDDDKDAMRSRIKTATDALKASVVEKP